MKFTVAPWGQAGIAHLAEELQVEVDDKFKEVGFKTDLLQEPPLELSGAERISVGLDASYRLWGDEDDFVTS